MLITATGFVRRRYASEFWAGGWEGVITAIFKESQLKFLDVEKEPSPPIDYLISSIPIIFARATWSHSCSTVHFLDQRSGD